MGTNDMRLTQELHVIRAHHLHYSSLLDDYSKHVDFIQNTNSPLMDTVSKTDREYIEKIMKRECDNLLTEVRRLKVELNIQEKRLKNVMGLVSHCYIWLARTKILIGIFLPRRFSAESILKIVGICAR
jgi:hypothetical protein